MTINVNRQVVSVGDKPTAVVRPQTQSSAETLQSKNEVAKTERNAVNNSTTEAKVKESEKTDEKQKPIIEQTVEGLNLAADKLQRNLEFSVDDSSGKTVITVKDRETDKVVRQIPSDEVLQIAERVENLRSTLEDLSGIIIRTEA